MGVTMAWYVPWFGAVVTMANRHGRSVMEMSILYKKKKKKKLPCNDPARAGQNEWMIDKGPYTQRYASSHLVGDSFVTTRRRELE